VLPSVQKWKSSYLFSVCDHACLTGDDDHLLQIQMLYEIGGACSMIKTYEKCILVRKPERKRPLERSRYRWEDNIKTDLKQIGCECVD
jgi:hypothetical protein